MHQLETARLTLRIHRLDDFGECAAMWRDPEVTRHIGGKPQGEEEVWARLLRYIGHWHALGFGYWVVRERGSERFIGEVGFANFKREIQPALGDAPEAGWVLARWSHGQGFATEAVRAVLAWSTRYLPERDTVCIIDHGNITSVRVAEKVGYTLVGEASYRGAPVLSYVRRYRA
jgi:RimJ/RimL family protein N-acetyltransferase